MKRRRTISAHMDHYYNNVPVKLSVFKVQRAIKKKEKGTALEAFTLLQEMVSKILSPLEVIDTISETASSNLPADVTTALEVIAKSVDGFKSSFNEVMIEFTQALDACPQVLYHALDAVCMNYDEIDSCGTEMFMELY